MPTQKLKLGLLILLAICIPLAARGEAQAPRFGFRAYDSSGTELRWERFRQVEENWKTTEGRDSERRLLCDYCKSTRECSNKDCKELCNPSSGDIDILLKPADLSVIFEGGRLYTLRSSEGRNDDGKDGLPIFDWPGTEPLISLAVAWPTTAGYYSTVILDIPRRDKQPDFWEEVREHNRTYFVFNFNLVSARQAVERLETMLRMRGAEAPPSPGGLRVAYRPSPAFSQQYAEAKRLLDSALRATGGNDRGRLGAQSFDAAVSATMTLQQEYGIQYGQALRGAMQAGLPPPQWGVTFEADDPTADMTDALGSVSELVGDTKDDGWVRLIFSKDREPTTYMPLIKQAHDLGLRVLGELRDSHDLAGLKRLEWQAYVRKYVDALSDTKAGVLLRNGRRTEKDGECDVDEWEVGNEVNGEWVVKDDPEGVLDSGEYIRYAANYIKREKGSGKRVLLTLYWQIGNLEDRRFSMFEWLNQNFNAAGRPLAGQQALFDDVGISLYPDKTPMGLAFDRVMSTLRTFFPNPGQRLMITELGYWPEHRTEHACEYGHIWRLGSVPDVSNGESARDRTRGEVAHFYQAAVLGYPYTGGGGYWWYYLQERNFGRNRGAVWSALNALHSTINGVRTDGELRRQ